MEQIEQAFDTFATKFAGMHKSAVEAAMKMNQVALKAQTDFAKQQMTLVETMLAASTAQVKVMTETRDPAEFMSKNAEIVVGLNEKLTAAAQETVEMQTKVRDEVAALVETNAKQFANGANGAAVAGKPAKASARKAA